MVKRLILFVTSLAVVAGLMLSGTSYAWFAASTKREQNISVSAISNVFSADLSDIDAQGKTVIVQGDNLVNLDGNSAELHIENHSTTETQIRVMIEYTSYRTGTARQVIYTASEDDDIIVEFADDAWAKNINAGSRCYFYYVGAGNGSKELTDIDSAATISSLIGKIPVVTKIAYKDDISDAYSGQEINIKVTFESKQAENVTWSSINTYDFSAISE